MDDYRVGLGRDLHRLEPAGDAGGGLRLGGLTIPSPRRAVAHSDGDALLHALADALLGAASAGDIGDLFPDTAAENRARDSADFVAEALRRLRSSEFEVVNVDANVVLEHPRLSPYKNALRDRLAALLGVSPACVSVKAKTAEGLGPVGGGEAVFAEVAVMARRAAKAADAPAG